MFRAFGWLLGLAGAGLASSALAGNPVYHCEPGTVEKDARIVAYPTDDIAAFSDPANRICTFAVNGATLTGPSEQEGRPSWQDLMVLLEQGNVRVLVLRLTAARQGVDARAAEFRSAAEAALAPVSTDLASCFKALLYFDEAEQPEPKFTEGRYRYFARAYENKLKIVCWVTPPGQFMEHSAEFPVLLLRVQSGSGTADALFVPQGAVHE